MEDKKKENNENKPKLGEKISLAFRRKLLIDGLITFLIVAILVVGYISINLWVKTLDLTDIDVTENKIYTLSDESKKAISKIDKEIKIYSYGYEEDSNFVNFLKQYHSTNEKITYELLTEEKNAPLIQKYNITNGNTVVILESGESTKVIDASEFSTYDYTTYESIDITEQTMTNSILALTEENKPKIYFVEGHDEYSVTKDLASLSQYLKNEAFEYDSINILTSDKIPDDCDILAIIAPNKDYFEPEVQKIKDYINKGGNIFYAADPYFNNDNIFTNLQKVLDEYGVSIKNGYVIEQKQGSVASQDYPYLILPDLSSTHEITADLYTDSKRPLIRFAGKLQYKDEATLTNLSVTRETLLSSTEDSLFITDINATNMNSALASAESGITDISAILTKSITSKNDSGEDEFIDSKMIIVTCAQFMSDQTIPELNSSYPMLVYSRDFVMNSLSYIADKGNILTIRKDMASSTYLPTDRQNIIVLAIIFFVPILIIIIGIIVWRIRKRRK